jgi:hypothetical protein
MSKQESERSHRSEAYSGYVMTQTTETTSYFHLAGAPLAAGAIIMPGNIEPVSVGLRTESLASHTDI